MQTRKVASYVPSIYTGYDEIEELTRVEDKMIDDLELRMNNAEDDQFIATATISGIETREIAMGIVADPSTEDLEFRRQRLINRYSMTPPFTVRFLKQKLNELIGVNQWELFVDYENRTLYISSSAENQLWFKEVALTVNMIKPCNLVFINRPMIQHNIFVNEGIKYLELHGNYILGQWSLGRNNLPFVSNSDERAVKMPNIRSVTDAFTNELAVDASNRVVKVRLNNSTIITELTKIVTDNILKVSYNVTPEMTGVVTLVELLGATDEVLTSSTVYVPITANAQIEHTILVEEGVTV